MTKMKLKNYVIRGILIFLISGCSASEPELRIGSNVWPGYELIFLAKNKNFFGSHPVHLVEMPSATVIIQALSAGTLEGALLTLDEVLTARSEGLDLKIVTVLDISMGGDALIAGHRIKNLSDLRGKTIGVEQSAVGAVMLSAVIQKAGLKIKDVKLKQMNVNYHAQAYSNGDVDALVTFEPVTSILTKQGARVLFDSSNIPGRIIDVLAVRAEALEKSPGTVRALIRGHFRAREEFLKNPENASVILSGRLHIKPEEVPELYSGIELPDLKSNREWLDPASGKLQSSAEELQKVMLEANLLSRKINLNGIYDGRFLE